MVIFFFFLFCSFSFFLFLSTDDLRSCIMTVSRVYYIQAFWRFKPILGSGLRVHSHLSNGLQLRNCRAVAGNHKFSSRFSDFACFCDDHSNREPSKLVYLSFVINISNNFCVCAQPIGRRQNVLLAGSSVNGVRNNSFCSWDLVVFVSRNTIIELTFRRECVNKHC